MIIKIAEKPGQGRRPRENSKETKDTKSRGRYEHVDAKGTRSICMGRDCDDDGDDDGDNNGGDGCKESPVCRYYFYC